MTDEITRAETLLKLAKHFGLSELEWQEEGLRILVRREAAPVEMPAMTSTPEPTLSSTSSRTIQDTLIELRAPMTGVFYRAPSPDAPPYVEVGDFVDQGQIICLIEAMKVFNEVPAERSGKVVEICASSGQLVEQGAVLFRLEPEEVNV
ncbi:MAG: acetyl-CoA carboxylase biotin carboxyl carrier protein [Armatimonadota bacterium]